MKIRFDMKEFHGEDLNLKHVLIIYPGIQQFSLASQVEVVPLQAISRGVSLLDGF